MKPQVSVTHCYSYNQSEVDAAVTAALNPLGGLGAFVRPGQRVALKPNLLAATPPEAAITTHPAVVAAVARLVKECGGEPFIVDSPGVNVPFTAPGLKRLYNVTGMAAVESAGLASLNWDVSSVTRPVEDGVASSRLLLMRPIAEADVVICLPKLKTHMLTTISAGTKILFGAAPGLAKAAHHATYSRVDDFADLLLDIILAVKPALFILDAVIGMEGEGPGRRGHPRQLGVMAASTSAVEMDLAVCGMIGLDATSVPTLRAAARRGWVDLESCSLPSPLVPDFDVPAHLRTGSLSRRMLPFADIVAPLLSRQLTPSPRPNRALCTGCGVCADACPKNAITIHGRIAVVEQSRCCGCYCCHELCPRGAVDLKTPFLARVAQWIAYDSDRSLA